MEDKSAISQMYYQGKGKNDYCKLSAECSVQAGEVNKIYKILKERLQSDKEIWGLIEDFENALAEFNEEACADRFAEGFKFGLLLGVEAGASN